MLKLFCCLFLPLLQIADGYFVKYFASCVALVVYALPIYFKDPSLRMSQGELTSDYIRSMRLLQNTSRGVGDLILVYKRISNLASHTSRVAELLEQVILLHATAQELGSISIKLWHIVQM